MTITVTIADRIERAEIVRDRGEIYKIIYHGYRIAPNRKIYPTVEQYIAADLAGRGLRQVNIMAADLMTVMVWTAPGDSPGKEKLI